MSPHHPDFRILNQQAARWAGRHNRRTGRRGRLRAVVHSVGPWTLLACGDEAARARVAARTAASVLPAGLEASVIAPPGTSRAWRVQDGGRRISRGVSGAASAPIIIIDRAEELLRIVAVAETLAGRPAVLLLTSPEHAAHVSRLAQHLLPTALEVAA